MSLEAKTAFGRAAVCLIVRAVVEDLVGIMRGFAVNGLVAEVVGVQPFQVCGSKTALHGCNVGFIRYIGISLGVYSELSLCEGVLDEVLILRRYPGSRLLHGCRTVLFVPSSPTSVSVVERPGWLQVALGPPNKWSKTRLRRAASIKLASRSQLRSTASSFGRRGQCSAGCWGNETKEKHSPINGSAHVYPQNADWMPPID